MVYSVHDLSKKLSFHLGYTGCFGAKEINETCNSCEDIITAYENKGWHWDVLKFDVCMKGIWLTIRWNLSPNKINIILIWCGCLRWISHFRTWTSLCSYTWACKLLEKAKTISWRYLQLWPSMQRHRWLPKMFEL